MFIKSIPLAFLCSALVIVDVGSKPLYKCFDVIPPQTSAIRTIDQKLMIAKNYGLPTISQKGYGYHKGKYGFSNLKSLTDYDKDENATWADTSFGPHMQYGHRPGANVWSSLGWYRGNYSGRYGHATKEF